MKEEKIRSLWEKILDEEALEKGDGGVTYGGSTLSDKMIDLPVITISTSRTNDYLKKVHEHKTIQKPVPTMQATNENTRKLNYTQIEASREKTTTDLNAMHSEKVEIIEPIQGNLKLQNQTGNETLNENYTQNTDDGSQTLVDPKISNPENEDFLNSETLVSFESQEVLIAGEDHIASLEDSQLLVDENHNNIPIDSGNTLDADYAKNAPLDNEGAKTLDDNYAKNASIDNEGANTLDADYAKNASIDNEGANTLDADYAKNAPIDNEGANTLDDDYAKNALFDNDSDNDLQTLLNSKTSDSENDLANSETMISFESQEVLDADENDISLEDSQTLIVDNDNVPLLKVPSDNEGTTTLDTDYAKNAIINNEGTNTLDDYAKDALANSTLDSDYAKAFKNATALDKDPPIQSNNTKESNIEGEDEEDEEDAFNPIVANAETITENSQILCVPVEEDNKNTSNGDSTLDDMGSSVEDKIANHLDNQHTIIEKENPFSLPPVEEGSETVAPEAMDKSTDESIDEKQIEQTLHKTSSKRRSKETLHGISKKDLGITFQNYIIEKEIARGGMGVVNKGQQKSLKRDIAIKRIIPGMTGKSAQQKFISEALVTAYLDHPNIVPVYELGRDERGEIFLTMKLVKGVEWKKILHPKNEEEKKLAEKYDFEANVRILLDICDAIAFSHSRGIIHNDLKPENIMIGEFGEVLVMDWGIAVSINHDEIDLRTLYKSMVSGPMGTPHYMSPELAEGLGDQIGTWTDTYLLGAILYEIITNKPPHYEQNIWKSLMLAIQSNPPKFPKNVPQELKNICTKSLSKNPQDRYQNVHEFKEAIENFLKRRESLIITQDAYAILNESKAISAKESGKAKGKERNDLYSMFSKAVASFEQSLKLWEGNTAAANGKEEAMLEYARAALQNDDLGLSEAQLVGLDENQAQVIEIKHKIKQAKQAKIKAQKASKRTRLMLWAAVIAIVSILSVGFVLISNEKRIAEANAERATANAKLAKTNEIQAQKNAEDTKKQVIEAEKQRKEAEKQKQLAHEQRKVADNQKKVAQQQERIRAQEARAAKKTLAQISLQKASEAYDNEQWKNCVLFAGSSLELTKNLHGNDIEKIREQNKKFIKLALLKEHLVWESIPNYKGKAHKITYSPNGKIFAIANKNLVYLWDTYTGRLIDTFEGHTKEVEAIVFSSNQNELASASEDSSIRLWQLDESGVYKILRGHNGKINTLAYHPSKAQLISGGEDKTIRIWNTETEDLKLVQLTPSPVRQVLYGAEGKDIIALHSNRKISIWSSEKEIDSMTLEDDEYTSIDFLNNTLICATMDGQIYIYDSFYKLIKKWQAHKNQIYKVKYSPDGKYIASSAENQELTLWDSTSYNKIKDISISQTIKSFAYSYDMSSLLCLDNDDNISRYFLFKPNIKDKEYFSPPSDIKCLVYSPDKKTLASASQNVIQLWNNKNGEQIIEWISDSNVQSLAYYPNSQYLASASQDSTIHLWDTKSKKHVQKFIGHNGDITHLGLSPDGKTYMTSAKDNIVNIWHVEDGNLLRSLSGHKGEIVDVIYSPRKGFIASGSQDKTVKIWSLKSGKTVFTLPHQTPITAICYSPDGRWLVSGEQQTLYLWDMKNGKLRNKYQGHEGDITTISFDRTGTMFCSGDKNKKIYVWDIRKNNPKYILKEHTGRITALQCSRKQNVLYSVSSDKFLCAWDLSSGRLLRKFSAHSADVVTMELSKSERFLASVSGKEVYLWDLQGGNLVHTFRGHTSWTRRVSFSPDEKLLTSVSADRNVKVWDIQRRSEIMNFEKHTEQTIGAFFTLDGKHLLSTSRGETVLWDLRTKQAAYTIHIGHKQRVNSIDFSSDGKWLISGSDDKTMRVWDMKTRKVVLVLVGHNSGINKVAFSPEDKWIASASEDKTLRIWNLEKQKAIFVLFGHKEAVTFVDFHPKGQSIISASLDKTVRLWNIVTGQEARILKEDKTLVNDMVFSPNGESLAIAYKNKDSVLLDFATEIPISYINRGEQNIKSLAYSSDGRNIATASKSVVSLWNVPQNKHLSVFSGHGSTVQAIAFSPDGKYLASGSDDRTIHIWDVAQEKKIASMDGYRQKIANIAFTKDSQYLIASGQENKICIWDLNTKKITQTLNGFANFAIFDKWIAYSKEKEIVVWDITAQKTVHSFQNSSFIHDMKFSTDGALLGCSGADGYLYIWNLQVPDFSYKIYAHEGPIYTMAFAYNDKYIVFSRHDNAICFIDLKKREEVFSFLSHNDKITKLLYIEDQKNLYSSSIDKTVRWWDLITNKQIGVIAQHQEAIYSIDYTSGLLATASADKTIRIWETISHKSGPVDIPKWLLNIIPEWPENIVQQQNRTILYRNSIAEDVLDYALDRQPLKVTQYLYHSYVSDTFAIKNISNMQLPTILNDN